MVFACEKIVRKARFFRQPALWSAQPRVRHLRNRASGTRAARPPYASAAHTASSSAMAVVCTTRSVTDPS